MCKLYQNKQYVLWCATVYNLKTTAQFYAILFKLLIIYNFKTNVQGVCFIKKP